MSSTFITALVSVLGQIIPAVEANATIITNIITLLTELVPAIIAEYQELVPEIQDIIQALQSTSAVTADQIAALSTLDAQCDAAFESEATAAGFPQT